MIVKADFKYTVCRLANYLWLEILASLIISAVVYYLYEHRELTFLSSFSGIPVSLLATILSVFLAFRNNSSFSRWWEARQLWGDLINASRMFHIQVRAIIMPPIDGSGQPLSETRLILLRRQVAYAHLLRMGLRNAFRWNEIEPYFSADEFARVRQSHNPAAETAALQSDHLRKLDQNGGLTDYRFMAMMGTLERFYNIQGACERIKKTPFPREYDGLIRVLVWVLIFSLPLYLLGIFSDDSVSKIFIIPITIISVAITGFANKAGEMLEDPFENRIHDVPLTAMCETIEKDLLSGETPNITPADRITQAETWVVW